MEGLVVELEGRRVEGLKGGEPEGWVGGKGKKVLGFCR
jgi:hypothetical protein